MRALPEGFEISGLSAALAEGWGFDTQVADYAPVGAGSYHWVVTDPSGTRAFVTVDDLDQKQWLGDTRESVFDALRAAFDTTVALRDAGLAFVVAPIPTNRGETVLRAGVRMQLHSSRSLTGVRGGSVTRMPPSASLSQRCSPSSTTRPLWHARRREASVSSSRVEVASNRA